jgi:hypothetical protein
MLCLSYHKINNLDIMLNRFYIFAICLIFCSCSSSKFDYNTAYQFSQYNYQKKEIQQEPTEHVHVLASLKPVVAPVATMPTDKELQQMSKPVTSSTESFKVYYENASKAERKVIRKQVKEDYKTLRKEYKKAKKDAEAKDIAFNSKMYIGLVLLGAGILIAILASGSLGAVTIIVGIGLLAWGFIEQA